MSTQGTTREMGNSQTDEIKDHHEAVSQLRDQQVSRLRAYVYVLYVARVCSACSCIACVVVVAAC